MDADWATARTPSCRGEQSVWKALQRYVPNLYGSHAQCLPLNLLSPWAYCGLGEAEVSYGLRYCRTLHPRPCLTRRLHPPEEEHSVRRRRPSFDEVPQLYIDPIECIDCGACVPVCPVSAIFALDDLPEKWKHYTELNASYVQGGTFTPEEYAKPNAAK